MQLVFSEFQDQLVRGLAHRMNNILSLFPGNSGPRDGDWLKIAVIDDGPGIRIEEATRIYEPFYSTKKRNQSAGLGLAVALGCAQQFGGTLQHRSRKDGTTFEMSLPAR